MTPISAKLQQALPTTLGVGRQADNSVVYNDLSALTRLKTQSKSDPQQALHEVAKQFESLFVTMMMQAMRDTLPKDGILNSSNMQSYQEMFDQQLSLDLSKGSGLGLASVIERQLGQTISLRSE